MRVVVHTRGSEAVERQLRGSKTALRSAIKIGAFRVGSSGVRVARAGFKTETRSGQRKRSWDAEVRDTREGVRLSVGPIKASAGGDVVLHARVQEGFDRNLRQVSEFIIRPKKPGGFLVFPIREGGGLSKASIVRWVKTRGPVTLTPDPSFPRVDAHVQPLLRKVVEKAYTDALG